MSPTEERRLSDDSLPLTRGDFKTYMSDHEAKEDAQRILQLERFMSAFPEGDPLKHRGYHDSLIATAQAQKRFWEIAQGKALEKGIDGIFMVLKIVILLAVAGLALKLGVAIPFLGAKP